LAAARMVDPLFTIVAVSGFKRPNIASDSPVASGRIESA
jgi:hypothetical protein